MLLKEWNWGIGLALPVKPVGPMLDQNCDKYSGMLFNSAQDVVKISKAGSEAIGWWLSKKENPPDGMSEEEDRDKMSRIQQGLVDFFGLPRSRTFTAHARIVQGMYGSRESYFLRSWPHTTVHMEIIANQMHYIDSLIRLARIQPTEVYIYCNIDYLSEGEDPNGNRYPGKVPRGTTTYWDKIHKEWLLPDKPYCPKDETAFTLYLRGTVVFCEWFMQSLKPSGRELLDIKIEYDLPLEQIDSRFDLTRFYGHEMLHTVPGGRGMAFMYTSLLDFRSSLLIISSQLAMSPFEMVMDFQMLMDT